MQDIRIFFVILLVKRMKTSTTSFSIYRKLTWECYANKREATVRSTFILGEFSISFWTTKFQTSRSVATYSFHFPTIQATRSQELPLSSDDS